MNNDSWSKEMKNARAFIAAHSTIDDVPSCGQENDFRRATSNPNQGELKMSSSFTPATPTVDRQATALEEVRKMHEDLASCRETIAQLKADLHHAEDRILLLTDERVRFRKESNIYRTKLIELATAMANIGLLTGQAQTILTATQELLDRVDGQDETTVSDNKSKIDLAVANIEAAIQGDTH